MNLESLLVPFRQWLIQEDKFTRASIDTYFADVGRFLKFVDRNSFVENNIDDIEKYLFAYFDSQKFKPNYARRIRAALLLFFSYPQVDFGVRQLGTAWLETNVDHFSETSKEISVKHVERLVQVAAERSRDIHKIRNVALIAFLYATGLPLSEVLDDVFMSYRGDIGTDGIYSHGVEDRVRARWRTSRKRRGGFVIPLHEDARLALQSWLLERLNFPGLRGWYYDPVWTNVVLRPDSTRLGHRLNEKSVMRLFETLSAHANLDMPVTPSDIRNLTMKQLGPGLETAMLLGDPLLEDDPALRKPDSETGTEMQLYLKRILEKIAPLSNLEDVLRRSKWQAEKPREFTFEHAKALVEGALSERNPLDAARGASFIGFLIGTGLFFEEAVYLNRNAVKLDAEIPHLILHIRGIPKPAPLSKLAQLALELWFSAESSSFYHGAESEPIGEPSLWWFGDKREYEPEPELRAWFLLHRLLKRGGLTFTVNSDEYRRLFRDAVRSGKYSEKIIGVKGIEPLSVSMLSDAEKSIVRRPWFTELRMMAEELAASEALNEFARWYEGKLEERFSRR